MPLWCTKLVMMSLVQHKWPTDSVHVYYVLDSAYNITATKYKPPEKKNQTIEINITSYHKVKFKITIPVAIYPSVLIINWSQLIEHGSTIYLNTLVMNLELYFLVIKALFFFVLMANNSDSQCQPYLDSNQRR